MESPPSYSKQIVKRIQEDPDYPSFGARIAEIAEPTLTRGNKYLPLHAVVLIDRLVDAVRNLMTSKNTQDCDIYPYAHNNFYLHDRQEFIGDMMHQLSLEPETNIFSWIEKPRENQYRDIALLAIWNRNRQRDFQRQLDIDTPDLINSTMDRVEYLIKEGVYPAKTLDLYHDAIIRHGPYRAMDSFESGLTGAAGWCDNITGKVSLANLYSRPSDFTGIDFRLQGVVYHEETHSMGSMGRGFFRGIATPHYPLRIWEEFWASHSQASTDLIYQQHSNGHPYNLNPNSRLDRIRYYPKEGVYAWSVHELTNHSIPADLIGHAYTSELDPHNLSPERSELEGNILKIFGSKEEWFAIEDKYESFDTQAKREEYLGKATRQIWHTKDKPEKSRYMTRDVIKWTHHDKTPADTQARG